MTTNPLGATLAAACVWASLACGPAMADSRLDGLWSLDLEWCGNDPAETDHVPMSVSLPMLLTHGSACEVQSLAPLGIQPARMGGGDAVPGGIGGACRDRRHPGVGAPLR